MPGAGALRSLVDRAHQSAFASSQFVVLTRAFFARFFDTEITGGAADLRMTLFWLMAFLSAPGMFMPIMMSIGYDIFALQHGTEALRVASRGHKTMYLAFTMVASGAVSAFVWNSLLLDRRDSLVLGTLPVRGPTIVRAKITSLGAYIGVVAIGMHTLASISFGFCLGARNTAGFAFAGMAAHFIAATGASAFVFLTVTAIQGVLLASLGPRRFDVVSPVFQVLVVAVVLVGLASLPAFDFSASGPAPWLLRLPPLWFLGVYESVLLTDDPLLIGLNRMAIGALVVLAAITFISCSLAYRRLASTVAESGGVGIRPRGRHRAADWLASVLGRAPVSRASVQFFLAAIARSSRHRFVAAASLGLPLVVAVPVLFRSLPELAAPPPTPALSLLALPLHTMVFLLVGLRIAAALPTDLGAGWAITSIGPPTIPLRAGAWRTMFALGAVPITLLTMPIYWRVWGAAVAVPHALVCLALGATLTEALLWGCEQLPCSRPWRPEHANLRVWWPAYLLGFLAITVGLPTLEQQAFGAPLAVAGLVVGLAAIAAVLRITHNRRRVSLDQDLDEPDAVQLLNLN